MFSNGSDDDRETAQLALFDAPPVSAARLPEGLVYEAEWLSRAEEAELVDVMRTLPFANATYKAYTARRRVVGYGGRFDYDRNVLLPAPPLIDALHPLRSRVAHWAGLPEESLEHTLVSEYVPGTPLGWHRDVPDFEDVIGVSLGTPGVLRFRPYPPEPKRRADIVRLTVEPRSIYAMRGPARWAWQHSVAPVEALRWSITFRTRRRGAVGRSTS